MQYTVHSRKPRTFDDKAAAIAHATAYYERTGTLVAITECKPVEWSTQNPPGWCEADGVKLPPINWVE